MNIIWAILIGLTLGALSAFLTHRRDPGSIVVRMLVGVVGGIIAAVVAVNISPTSDSGIWISAAGAFVLLFIYGLIVGKRKKT